LRAHRRYGSRRVTAPIGPTDPLSLSALDVTLEAAGLDTVIAAFAAVDAAGEKAAGAGVVPMSAPGSAETIAAIRTASALLDQLGISAKTTAAGGVQTLVVAERDLANTAAMAEQASAARNAATATRELATAQRSMAAPPVTFRGGGESPPRFGAPPV